MVQKSLLFITMNNNSFRISNSFNAIECVASVFKIDHKMMVKIPLIDCTIGRAETVLKLYSTRLKSVATTKKRTDRTNRTNSGGREKEQKKEILKREQFKFVSFEEF